MSTRAKRRLDPKARNAVIAAAVMLLAVPGVLLLRMAGSDSGPVAAEQSFKPQRGQLVMLRDGSTVFIKHNSTGQKIADWLRFNRKGDQKFEISNANFTAGSAALTHDGWEHVVQFAHLLNAHRNVKAMVLFYPFHGDPTTEGLEHIRADRIREEVLKEGVRDDQIAVAREGFEPGHNAASDRGLEVVLINRG